MRVSNAQLDEVRERGFSVIDGFLGGDELAAAQEGLWLECPRPDDYFATLSTSGWRRGRSPDCSCSRTRRGR